jgi:hypothetical protein
MLAGHLVVTKHNKNGSSEILLDDHNILTKGLAVNVVEMLTDTGSQKSVDFVPSYFQIGTSTVGFDDAENALLATSSHFFQVCASMESGDYGDRTDLRLFEGHRGFQASTDGTNWGECFMTSAAGTASSIVSSTPGKEWFIEIEPEYTTKYFIDSVQYRINLDEHTCNGQSITEVGLFCKNPLGLTEDHPLMLAYKKFDTAFTKTKNYTLTFDWAIGWLGAFTAFDRHVNILSEDSRISSKWFIP